MTAEKLKELKKERSIFWCISDLLRTVFEADADGIMKIPNITRHEDIYYDIVNISRELTKIIEEGEKENVQM